jgi:hypothetical protein
VELARHGARGLVQDAVLLGAPVPAAPARWRAARRAVAGRLVCGWSSADWLLATLSWPRSAAGLEAVAAPGVEAADLSGLVDGHFVYVERMGEVLEALGVQG